MRSHAAADTPPAEPDGLQLNARVTYPAGQGLNRLRGVLVALEQRRAIVKPAFPEDAPPVELRRSQVKPVRLPPPRPVRVIAAKLEPLASCDPARAPVRRVGAVRIDACFSPQPKPPGRFRCRRYLTFIRQLPCCGCGTAAPSHAHHYGPRGVGTKADDLRTVPLCALCHEIFHLAGTLPDRDAAQAREHIYRVQLDLIITFIREGGSR